MVVSGFEQVTLHLISQPILITHRQHVAPDKNLWPPDGASDQLQQFRGLVSLFTPGIWTNLNMILTPGLGCAPSPPQTTPPTYSSANWYRLSTVSNNGEVLTVHQSVKWTPSPPIKMVLEEMPSLRQTRPQLHFHQKSCLIWPAHLLILSLLSRFYIPLGYSWTLNYLD